MPKNPEREGSPRLISIKQIAEEHGVSRSSVHTYRRSATFPQPAPVEGSTRIQYRADEVAAWFEANPPQQGKKRTPSPQPQQGEAMATPAPTTVDPRLTLMSRLHTPPYDEAAGTYSTPLGEAAQLLDAYKAAVLREAVAELSALLAEEQEAGAIVDRLSEMADETEQGVEAQDG